MNRKRLLFYRQMEIIRQRRELPRIKFSFTVEETTKKSIIYRQMEIIVTVEGTTPETGNSLQVYYFAL